MVCQPTVRMAAYSNRPKRSAVAVLKAGLSV
jgi:hypothetical protein